MNRILPSLRHCFIALLSLPALAVPMTAAPADDSPVERAAAATAWVTSAGRGLGTAFCIRKDGQFLTNAHVVDQRAAGADIVLRLNSGEGAAEKALTARVVHVSRTHDLALLKVDGQTDLPTLDLVADVATIRLGQDIRILGFPFGPIPAGGENPSVSLSRGVVSSLRKAEGTLRDIQIDAAVNPGNSGGPLFADDGKVLGVVASRIGGVAQNLGFAIAANRVVDFLREPRLTLRDVRIDWDDRRNPHTFVATVLPGEGDTLPDELELTIHSAGAPRSVRVAAAADGPTELQLAPWPDAEDPITLAIRRGTKSGPRGGGRSTLADVVLSAQSGLRLSHVEWIVGLPDNRFIFLLRDGQQLPLTRGDLALDDDAAAKILPPTHENTTVHLVDQTLGAFALELKSLKSGRELSRIRMQSILGNRPLFANHPGDGPKLAEGDPRERFTIGVWAEGVFETRLWSDAKTAQALRAVSPVSTDSRAADPGPNNGRIRGLQMSYTLGPPPGYWSLCGPCVFIEHRLLHPFFDPVNPVPPTIKRGSPATRVVSGLFPMKVKDGRWRCQVRRDWSAGAPGKDLIDGEAETRNDDDGLTVRVSTPKYQVGVYRLLFERDPHAADAP